MSSPYMRIFEAWSPMSSAISAIGRGCAAWAISMSVGMFPTIAGAEELPHRFAGFPKPVR